MMSDLVLIAIITGVPATINAVNSWMARKEAKATKTKLDEVGLRVDGRLDQLLNVTQTSSFAAGAKSEIDKTRAPEETG
jgi:hypothetical protein